MTANRHGLVLVSSFKQVNDYESSTRFCPCGSSITWSGFDGRLDVWMAVHGPHVNCAEVEATTSLDGERAYTGGKP